MKKKLVGMLLVSVMCFSLMACTEEDSSVETNLNTGTVESTVEASTTEESTEESFVDESETASMEESLITEVGMVYGQYVGEYSVAENKDGHTGYLTIEESPDVIKLHLDLSQGWTETEDWVVEDDGTLTVTCDYYYSEAEPDDYMKFTLKAENGGITMTIIETEFPMYEEGDVFFFTTL